MIVVGGDLTMWKASFSLQGHFFFLKKIIKAISIMVATQLFHSLNGGETFIGIQSLQGSALTQELKVMKHIYPTLDKHNNDN